MGEGQDPREGPKGRRVGASLGKSWHSKGYGPVSACLVFVSQEGGQARSPGTWQGRKGAGVGAAASPQGVPLSCWVNSAEKWPSAWPRGQHCSPHPTAAVLVF